MRFGRGLPLCPLPFLQQSSRITSYSMRLPLYILPCSAVLLEGLILWRFSKKAMWHRYPYLVLFVAYDLLGNLVLFPIRRYKADWFAVAYWQIEWISLFLRFLINWEFFRGIFRRESALRDVGYKVLLAVELIGLPAILFLGWSQASAVRYVYMSMSPVVEQYFSLAQALLLLTPAAVARYYGLALGRNVRGLGFGFGLYALVRAMNFASLQAIRGFVPYWRFLVPASLIAMMAVWLWGFWEYAPSPALSALDEEQSYQWKIEWRRLWAKTTGLLGGGIS